MNVTLLIFVFYPKNKNEDQVANIFFELSREGRSHMFGPLNPYFDLPGILRNLLEKYSEAVQ